MEQIETKVNPDIDNGVLLPVHNEVRFIDGKLYQYQWSSADGKWAWYQVPGQENL